MFLENNMKEEFQRDKNNYLLSGFKVEIISKRFQRIKNF